MSTKEDLSGLKVGDRVWIVGHGGYRRVSSPVPMHPAVVDKVGRKYLTVTRLNSPGGERSYDTSQFDKDGGDEKVSGFASRTIYIDIQHYARAMERRKAWEALCKNFRGWTMHLHEDVTTENIREAAKLLRIPMTDEDE